MSVGEGPVFFDPRGRRWRRVRWTWLLLAIVVTVLAIAFVASVLINPLLPRLDLRPVTALPHAEDLRVKPPPPPAASRHELRARRAEQDLRRMLQSAPVTRGQRPTQMKIAPPPAASTPAPVSPSARDKPLSIGFFVNWDDSSYSSLKRNLAQLDWVIPEWVRLQSGPDPLIRDIDPPALDLIRREKPTTAILPLVQNYQNEQWNSELIAAAIADAPARTRLVNALLTLVEQSKFNGVCIDFEEVPETSQSNLLLFM
ncbi:MAG TPA: hypothetical protein VM870_05720, partial [Pyrinomonadaceae bacterium]|nr:hypothetical protein [Pyrinomonadaceae bacterium]